jgi:hypothetical protein
MANTWIIEQLDCYPEHDGRKDVVFNIHWRRSAGPMVDIYGSQAVTINPDAPFTPFANLTKKQVVQWLVDAMGASRVAEIDASLAAAVEAKAKPSVLTPALPWGA